MVSPPQAVGLQLALTLRPILLGCSIMGFVFGMALSGRGAASACPVNLVSWWVSGVCAANTSCPQLWSF